MRIKNKRLLLKKCLLKSDQKDIKLSWGVQPFQQEKKSN